MSNPAPPDERLILLLVGAVQFVNILDFMMVMPLGPDFADSLAIPLSSLGLVAGSYTAAAAVAGIVGSFFLDRFDRRTALAIAMLGLVLGTAAGGLAVDLRSMVAARVVAGAFGGPATSIAIAIIADVVPPERRGRAMGQVMGSFSVASVVGVPLGLEIAHYGGWRLPFFSVAGLGLLVALGAVWRMPPLRLHLDRPRTEATPILRLLRQPLVLYSLLATASVTAAAFSLFPNLTAWVQYNAGYPREHLGILYMVGGACSFFSMRIVGGLIDRFGGFWVALAATLFFVLNNILAFCVLTPVLPMAAVFVVMMVSNSSRNVALNTLTSRVPRPEERARFLSTQSAVQHSAAAAGAMFASRLLVELPDHRLDGIGAVATFSAVCALMLPALVWIVERRLKATPARSTHIASP